ncbi:MAG: chromate transporter [Bacillota bacterium]|jgi:chromate transporter|nr:chromate transporter [Bacillota bacterium]HHT90604.1 chromate transporter [Bacillota bacterium]
MILFQLFSAFFKIGLFTLGGGYAMLALIQQEIVRYGWMTPQEFVDVVGIAEVTPGPIAVNAATFVGFRTAGVQGALVATGAVVLPSLISVMIVSRVWARYKNSHIVQNMFAGIRPVVVGLVGAAAVLVGLATFRSLSSGIHGLYTLVLGGLTFYGVAFRKWDPIKVLVGAALIGLIVYR